MKKISLLASAVCAAFIPMSASAQSGDLEGRITALEERISRLEGGDFPLAYIGETLTVGRYNIVFKGCEVRGVSTECFLGISYAGPQTNMRVKQIQMISGGEDRWKSSYCLVFGSEQSGDSFTGYGLKTGTYPASFVFEGLQPGETYGLNFTVDGEWARFRGYVQP